MEAFKLRVIRLRVFGWDEIYIYQPNSVVNIYRGVKTYA